jgi:hypothetical protein
MSGWVYLIPLPAILEMFQVTGNQNGCEGLSAKQHNGRIGLGNPFDFCPHPV